MQHFDIFTVSVYPFLGNLDALAYRLCKLFERQRAGQSAANG